ncbi:hypothetical protein B0H11DRAFT_2060789 [Mycena galericulata]|nr:hypothetical protein B0H11DRAFT_2060789 [Mycena galericulata]
MSTTPFACTTPTFTPIVSLADPNYNPLQLGMPSAGQVFFLSNLSTIGNIQVAPNFIDDSFNYGTNPVPQMTMELVESATLKSAGFATINNTQAAYQYLPTDRFTLTAGAWKIRANWTSGNHGGNFTTLSDEFYIATSGPCVGLQSGQSTTGGGSTSSGSGSTKPSGALSSSGISFATLCVLVLTLVAGTVVAL